MTTLRSELPIGRGQTVTSRGGGGSGESSQSRWGEKACSDRDTTSGGFTADPLGRIPQLMCPQLDGHVAALHAATSICGWAQPSQSLWRVPSALADIAGAGMALGIRTTCKLVPRAKNTARKRANFCPSLVRIASPNIETRAGYVEGAARASGRRDSLPRFKGL